MNEQGTSTERHWKVRVCRWWVTSIKPDAKPKHDRITVLVQAPDSQEAMNRGCGYAVNNAPIGPLWKGFEAQEAASVELPIQI